MKMIFVAAGSLLCCFLNTVAIAEVNSCDGTISHPCVVQDMDKDKNKASHFRTASMIRNAYKGNTRGLKHLWISVSGMPSEKSLSRIIKQIEIETHGKYQKIIDLDLREESHAYLNGVPITLMSEHNWINKGKSHQQAMADEEQWVHSLQTKTSVSDVLTTDQFNAGQFNEGIAVKVKSILPEQDVAEHAGMEYKRLTVSDHMRPGDSEVDAFVNLVRQTPDNVWIHMHCRGGNGRSSTFFVMMDMMKNASQVSFNDIIKRQAAVKPYYDLSDINRKDGENSKEYLERYQFLQRFYQFATDVQKGYQGTWSQWMQARV